MNPQMALFRAIGIPIAAILAGIALCWGVGYFGQFCDRIDLESPNLVTMVYVALILFGGLPALAWPILTYAGYDFVGARRRGAWIGAMGWLSWISGILWLFSFPHSSVLAVDPPPIRVTILFWGGIFFLIGTGIDAYRTAARLEARRVSS